MDSNPKSQSTVTVRSGDKHTLKSFTMRGQDGRAGAAVV